MTLSVYDPKKKCKVLNPKAFVINAFHPDYVKTYMPEFLSDIRLEATQKANGIASGQKAKATQEAKNKGAFTTNTKSKKVDLAVRQYYTFAKAGMPKGVK